MLYTVGIVSQYLSLEGSCPVDEAKAIIDVKKGIIELEGPVDFVRRYLGRYQPPISHLRGLPKAVAASPEKAGPPNEEKKRGPCLKATRSDSGAGAAIRKYLESGFFEQPRSFRDVREHLANNRVICKDSLVRASLKKLVGTGALKTTGVASALRYYTSRRS